MTTDTTLQLADIQGDILEGLQKNYENFIFFKIVDVNAFKEAMRDHVIPHITTAEVVHSRELANQLRQEAGKPVIEPWLGLNVSFTSDGMTQLLGAGRPKLMVTKAGQPADSEFENGAAAATTALNDPPAAQWLPAFTADTIHGVFLVTGPDERFTGDHSQKLLNRLGASVKVVYQEMAHVRPDAEKGHEHFGFQDGISQPGVRGLTKPSNPNIAPDQGMPGQDLIWPGEFVFGYPAQDPANGTGQVAPPDITVPWATNGSFMVFRRLEQKVPEFNTFVAQAATANGMTPELLASRMVGRWRSGAPMELTPLQDDISLGTNDNQNNNFSYGGDAFQRACPYAAHIRKTNPRDDFPAGNKALVEIRRIIRAGIPFGPEVAADEDVTKQSRGLMFVCYQTSIASQFEFMQSQWVNSETFIFGKTRPAGGGGGVITIGGGAAPGPGFDTIIGQAPGGGAREMDEPVPNYPMGNFRSSLNDVQPFVQLTAAGYFFVPSISALRTVLT